MTKEVMEQFKKLSEHDQKEVLNLIRLKNKFKKQEIERKAKAYDELIDYLKEEINKIKEKIEHYDLWHEVGTDINFLILKRQLLEEILNKIEKR